MLTQSCSGDSYTASGFDINGAQPSPANPMGNPPLGQPFTGSQPGTMSGGMNYIDWLTSHYNTTETYTFDFAHSQATVSNNLSPVDGVPSFEDQVATLYKPKYSDKPADVAPWTGDNTIFTVFFGINDIQNNYKTGAIDTFIPQTLDLYFAQIQALYDTGARKLVFVGVPPLDRSPRVMQEDPSGAGTWSQWQTNYNAQLAQRANDFGGSHSDVSLWSPSEADAIFARGSENPACANETPGTDSNLRLQCLLRQCA